MPVYTMAIIRDGEIIATKTVRSHLEGVMAAVTPNGAELKEIEHAWMRRGLELARDVLHREGRWPPKRSDYKPKEIYV